MRWSRNVLAVLVVALAATGCGSSDKKDQDPSTAGTPAGGEVGLPPAGDSAEAGQAAAAGSGSTTTAPARPSGKGSPTPTTAPASSGGGGTATAPAEPDDFERMFPIKGTRAASGENDLGEWRIYVYKQKGETCIDFWLRNKVDQSRGGTGACHLRPPVDVSGSIGSEGRIAFGLAAAEAVKARFEHSGGGTETFNTVAVTGFTERFFVGEIAKTPLDKVVALDARGKVVGEKTDLRAFNVG